MPLRWHLASGESLLVALELQPIRSLAVGSDWMIELSIPLTHWPASRVQHRFTPATAKRNWQLWAANDREVVTPELQRRRATRALT